MNSNEKVPAKYIDTTVRSMNTSLLDNLESDSLSKKSKKVSSACDTCRKRHARCNGENPCNHCIKQKKQCSYILDDRRRKKSRNEQTWALESQVEELQATLNVLRTGTATEASEVLKSLRSRSGDLSPSSPSRSSATAFSEPPDGQITESTSHPSTLLSLESLPNEQLIYRGARSCFTTLAGVFWIMSAEVFKSLCDKVYRPNMIDPSVVDLAEMCAFAATGWQYEIRMQSDSQKERLFRTAARHIYDAIELDQLRAGRLLSCMAIYGILNRKTSTRSLVWLAIQMLRWSPKRTRNATWKRIFRTIAILESWLSTLMGYPMTLSSEEMELTTDENDIGGQNTSEMGEIKIAQIAYLRAQIIETTWYSSNLKYPFIETHMARLAEWHANLPVYLELSGLKVQNNQDNSNSNPRTLLLIHVLYLGAVLSLHRQILIAIAEHALTRQWHLDISLQSRAKQYYESAVDAARSSARIFLFSILGNDKDKTFLRCWICSFEVLTSCTVLLYDIALRLSSGHSDEVGIEHDLQRTRSCLNLLGASDEEDPAVEELSQLLDATTTAWLSVKQLSLPAVSSPAIMDSVPEDPQRLARPIISQICEILKDPFGHRAFDDSKSVSLQREQS